MKFIYSIFLLLILSSVTFIANSCGNSSSGKKTIIIARDPTGYPLTLQGKEQNLIGFLSELLLSIAAEKKIELILVPASANDLIDRLEIGSYDAVVSSLLPSFSNREAYAFSDPLFLSGPVLVTPKDSPLTDLLHVKKKLIGVPFNSPAAFNLLVYPSVTIIPYNNLISALDQVAQGRVDGILANVVPAHVYISSLYHDKLKIATAPLTKEGLRLIALKDPEGEEIIQLFDEQLKVFKENGVYDHLLEKWGFFDFSKGEEIPKI